MIVVLNYCIVFEKVSPSVICLNNLNETQVTSFFILLERPHIQFSHLVFIPFLFFPSQVSCNDFMFGAPQL